MSYRDEHWLRVYYNSCKLLNNPKIMAHIDANIKPMPMDDHDEVFNMDGMNWYEKQLAVRKGGAYIRRNTKSKFIKDMILICNLAIGGLSLIAAPDGK